MINAELIISKQHFDELKVELFKDSPNENAAFLLIGSNTKSSGIKFLTRRIIKIPSTGFKVKSPYHLRINPEVINGIIRLAEINKLGVAICHSHPNSGNMLQYSPTDDFGESEFANFYRNILPNFPLISLLFSENKITGRVVICPNNARLDGVKVIGDKISVLKFSDSSYSTYNDIEKFYDRQVLLLGSLGQSLIQKIKVAIVGVGGTGSSVAEQLVRMGVQDMIIIDKDIFDASNITRIYGSTFRDLHKGKFWQLLKRKKYKVKILKRHLKAINPKLTINAIASNVVLEETGSCLLDRDIIFSCTDDHWGRSVLNQIAYQYLIPLINVGMRIDSENGIITAGTVAAHLVGPDHPCLWCYDYLKSDIISLESMNKTERTSLLREGYVQNIDTNAPSIISFTSLAASLGVNIFLQLITGYLGKYSNFNTLHYDILTGKINRGTTMVDKECICQQAYGFGDFKLINFLDDESLLPN